MRSFLALGAIFVGGVAVSGCGSAVPGNAVAVVAGNPITARAYAHWAYIAAVANSEQSPGSPLIIPDPPNYPKCLAALKKIAPSSVTETDLKNICVQQSQQTMEYLIRSSWVQGEAAEQHVKVSAATVMAQFNKAKSTDPTLKTTAGLNAFLKETGQTLQDILYRLRVELLSQDLATKAAVKAYYNQHLSEYTTPASVDVRLFVTKTAAQASAGRAAVAHGASWAATTKRYGISGTTNSSHGAITHVFTGEEPAAVNTAIFAAKAGQLLAPIKTPFGYYVVKVTQALPKVVTPLSKVSSTIKETLENNAIQSPPWEQKWKAKTTCRSSFATTDCKNYVAPKTTTTSSTSGAGSTVTSTTSTPSSTTTSSTPTATTGTSTTKKK